MRELHDIANDLENMDQQPVPEMSPYQKDQVLAVLKHYMSMELRGRVMREVPQAYNAWMGRKYVAVIHTSDGRIDAQ